MLQNLAHNLQRYGKLSNEALEAFCTIVRKREIPKNEFYLEEGAYTKTVAFVVSGLFSQSYLSAKGNTVIKRFFHENHFMASLSALITKSASSLSIKALEDSTILEYNFFRFKELSCQFPDLAQLYINYLEKHWVVEKEPLEISYRHDTAVERYANFLNDYPGIESRVKQHQVAAYLGITPTQLSRIRAEVQDS